MRVLIIGATGFIGRHVAAALHARGHEVVGTSRRRREAFSRHPEYGWICADLHRDIELNAWARKLYAFDAVVNCAGLYRETPGATFETVHALGPLALYRACERARIGRVVHLTPLGDAAAGRSHLLASRRYVEARLESLALDWVVLAHPLIVGEDSPAVELLLRTPAPALRGREPLAPLAIEDLCEAVTVALEFGGAVRRRYSLAGPDALAPAELAEALRGSPRAWRAASRTVGRLAELLPRRAAAPAEEMIPLLARATGANEGFTELTAKAPRRVVRGGTRLTLLYDSACPICVFEMKRLAGLDRARKLDYRDIADPLFDPSRLGTTMDALMGRMHALTPSGTLLVGMDAIRAAYSAVGLGWLLAPTAFPLLRPLCDRLYLAFARHRYDISRWLGMRCEGACRLS